MTDVLSSRFHSDAPLVDELRTALSESASALFDVIITEDVAKKVVDTLARLDHEQLADASDALQACEGVVRAAPGCERLARWLEFLIGCLAAGEAPDGCGVAVAILFLALQRQTDFTIPGLGDFIVETFEPALPALSDSELGTLLSAVFATDPGPSVMLQLVRAARTALRANRPESSLATQLALHEFWALSELGPPDLGDLPRLYLRVLDECPEFLVRSDGEELRDALRGLVQAAADAAEGMPPMARGAADTIALTPFSELLRVCRRSGPSSP